MEYAQIVTDTSIQPFQRWGIDLIGVLPKTALGKRWIIVAVDYATGWPVAKAVAKATEDNIAEFIFNEIYMHFGAPQEIFSDGERSCGEEFKRICTILGWYTREPAPITHGQTAKWNG